MPRTAISPSCMSGFDSFSKGLAFQLCNCNGFLAIEKIYFLDPNQPAAPFLKLQLHHKMSKSCAINSGSKVLEAFCRRNEEPILPENTLRCLLPQPCLPFKAQTAGTFSGKLTWKAVEGQRCGFVQLCRSLGPGAG